MEAYGVSAPYHAMNTYFLVDAGQVILTDIGDFDYLTGVYLFRRIDRGSNSLLLCAVYVLKQVGCQLRLADLSVLTLTEYVIHKDNEVIYLADLRLFINASSARRSSASIRSTRRCSTCFGRTAFG